MLLISHNQNTFNNAFCRHSKLIKLFYNSDHIHNTMLGNILFAINSNISDSFGGLYLNYHSFYVPQSLGHVLLILVTPGTADLLTVYPNVIRVYQIVAKALILSPIKFHQLN